MEPTRPGDEDEGTPGVDDRPVLSGRRSFVRALGREGVRSAGQIAGAIGAISAAPMAIGADLLHARTPEVPSMAAPAAPPASRGRVAEPPAPDLSDLRPWRLGAGALHVLDQRELPHHRRELVLDSAAAVAASLESLATPFGVALGEIASIGLAIAARAAASRPPAERSRALRWNLRLLRGARPGSAALEAALAGQDAILHALPPDADGETVAVALSDAAGAFAARAAHDTRALATAGASALAVDREEPLRILTIGSGGALAGGGGPVGTLIAELAARPPGAHVWLMETRPTLVGSRIAAHELVAAGVTVTLLADAAAGELLCRQPIDVVLLPAERIGRAGDVLAVAGTYPLAVLAARHGVPVYVVGPSWLVEPSTPEAPGPGAAVSTTLGFGVSDPPRRSRPEHELAMVLGTRLTPGRSQAFVPLVDVTPADLVTALVCENGLSRPGGPAWPDRRTGGDGPPGSGPGVELDVGLPREERRPA